MDAHWLARLAELEEQLTRAARELLDHTGSASAQLELGTEAVVFVGPPEHLEGLNSQERNWIPYQEGQPLPEEVEGVLPPGALDKTKH